MLKDKVVNGFLLEVAESSLTKIKRQAAWAIRKAVALGVETRKSNDLTAFKKLHFKPEALPKKLLSNQSLFLAFLNKQPVAGVVVEEKNGWLFYKYAGSNAEGRKNQANSLLIWRIIEAFEGKGFKYLDLGTSYRSNLALFKKQFATATYPVIFDVPKEKPIIRFLPGFKEPRGRRLALKSFFNKPFTLTRNGRAALALALKEIGLSKKQEVWVSTTFETPYLSRCVSETIERVSVCSRSPSNKTGAVLAVHELGFPHPKIKELRDYCDAKSVPLIEDCAHSMNSMALKQRVGGRGDYAVYSFPKSLPVKSGGALVGVGVGGESDAECFLPRLNEYSVKRRTNYDRLKELFETVSLEPLAEAKEGTSPYVFPLLVEETEKFCVRLREFGVQCGVYWPNDCALLPVHQFLSEKKLDYLFACVKPLYY